MEGSKILFYSSKFPWARERNFSKFIDNKGTRNSKNVRRPWSWGLMFCVCGPKNVYMWATYHPRVWGFQRI